VLAVDSWRRFCRSDAVPALALLARKIGKTVLRFLIAGMRALKAYAEEWPPKVIPPVSRMR